MKSEHSIIEEVKEYPLFKRIIDFIEKYYLLLIYLFFLMKLQSLCAHSYEGGVSDYEFSTYLLNYTDGFGTRLLIGSILQMIFGPNISHEMIYIVSKCFLVLAVFLVSYILWKLVYLQKTLERKGMVLLLTMIFFALPSTAIWAGNYLGSLDIYLVLYALLSMWILTRPINDTIKYFIVMIIGLVAILTHQVYILTYFIPVFSTIVWDIVNGDFSKKKIWKVIIIIMIPIAIFFLYMQLSQGIHFDTLQEVNAICSQRTSENYNDRMLELEYVYSLKENFIDFGLHIFSENIGELLVVYAGFTPFWILLFLFWKQVFRDTKDVKRKAAFLLMHISFIVLIPLFLFTTDSGRWTTVLLLSIMSNIFLGIYHKDEAMLRVLDNWYPICNKKACFVFLFIAYLFGMNLCGIAY